MRPMSIRKFPLTVALGLAVALAVVLFHGSALPVSAGINDLTQLDYRWYENVAALQPTTPLAAENSATTGVADGSVLRLRMNLANALTNLAAGSVVKLQYATSTGGPWTDVGGIGSGATWRGSDNPSVADGDRVSGTLLGTSDQADRQSYEEENNATTPATLKKGKEGEFDWVVQANGSSPDTNYYFRMVQGDGTALSAYANYPQVLTEGATLTQQDYRWYENADAVQPTTPKAAENTAITGIADTDVLRLRMNVGASAASFAAGESFKLQYATSTGGPWTDVGGIGSGETWRGFDNATPADGATLSATTLGSSEVIETYEEASPSASSPNAIPAGQEGEWDWVVQNNGASESTVYYFRTVKGDGTALETYSSYPQLTTLGLTLTQQDYRWYDNADAVQPTTPKDAENTAITGVADTDVLRLRMNVGAGGVSLATGESFKLQYTLSTDGPWTDVGAGGSGEIWRGFDNVTPADGATLSGTVLGSSEVLETYEEGNPSAATPNTVAAGQEGEWDWVVQNNGAADSTTYYFRMVYAAGSALNVYAQYPELSTAGGASVLTHLQYRWYDNTDAVQPTTALAAEDTPFMESAQGASYQLRMNVEATVANLDPGATFKLQYAVSTTGPWTHVGGLGSGLSWRGNDNPTPGDGSTLSTNLLSGSHAPAKETYEEANPSAATPNSVARNKAGEWGWVVQNNTALLDGCPARSCWYSDGLVCGCVSP